MDKKFVSWLSEKTWHYNGKDIIEIPAHNINTEAIMPKKALRYNQGKPQYSMIDLTCLEPCVRVLEFGAKKYARDNWKVGMPVSKILDSLLRHIARLQAGEIIDTESGLPHIGHIQCNALFLGNTANEQDIKVLEEKINGK